MNDFDIKVKSSRSNLESKYLRGALNELRNEILELKKVPKVNYIIGEYKWMKIGSIMPDGWKKADIFEGYTLVFGTNDGITKGSIPSHNHEVGWEKENTSTTARIEYDGNESRLGWSENTNFRSNFTKEFGEGENNLAAGMVAELWIYAGINK